MRNRFRLLGFAAIALLAGAATTAVCLSEAVTPFGARSTAFAATATNDPIRLLSAGSTWLNGQPTAQSLRGKVVVVNFWTYSCINSLRALPTLRAWADKYRDRGLVVIGVHAPEFGFEKDPANVRQALRQLGISYPVVLDNDHTLWRTFRNEGWPGFYFIDAHGQIRDYRVGEGDYAASERIIDTLLAEAGHRPADTSPVQGDGRGVEAAADWGDLASPETYIGFDKANGFQSPGGIREDVAFSYRAGSTLPLNHWDMAGRWTIGGEFATLNSPSGQIRVRFHARDLHLVLGAPADGRTVRFRVLLDGAPPGADHGADVDADGWGEVREDRLYQLIRQSRAVQDRTANIQFLQPGVRSYVFTFG